MKYQYIRAFIVLLAGLIALVLNIKTGRSVNTSLFIVLVVILVFYVIATLVIELLQRSYEWTEQRGEEPDEKDSDENLSEEVVEGEQTSSQGIAFDEDE